MDIHYIQCAVWISGPYSSPVDVQDGCCWVEKCILCVREAGLILPSLSPEELPTGSCPLWAPGLLLQGSSCTGTGWGCSLPPCVPARCLCGSPAGEAHPGKENRSRKGKASSLGVSSACAGLLPGLMSSRAGTEEGHWPGQGSWQPALLLARALSLMWHQDLANAVVQAPCYNNVILELLTGAKHEQKKSVQVTDE